MTASSLLTIAAVLLLLYPATGFLLVVPCPPQQEPPVSSKVSLRAENNVGKLTVPRPSGNKYQLAYRIARPMSLSSRQAAPMVVLHGGPSVPSDYLYPLESVVPYRSIIFYDQIGCGLSDEPTDVSEYSIDYALDDLEALIKKLGLRRFHLYGQSFGGILAFEYMKRLAERHSGNSDNRASILSAILSSSPTSVPEVEAKAEQLLKALLQDDASDASSSSSSSSSTTVMERFRVAHQCRTMEPPKPLVDAYAHAGSVWRGTTAIANYVASPPREGSALMPSCMVMRGEHDFVTDIEEWKRCFNHKFVRSKVLDGCSHHGLLEDGSCYGDIVDTYFAEYD
jgi:proline iminopeptidase